jgi:hypothetical protein
LILLSREPAVLGYHLGELTVSVNSGKLRRQLFLVSCGTKWNTGNLGESGGSYTKEPSNIGLPSES